MARTELREENVQQAKRSLVTAREFGNILVRLLFRLLNIFTSICFYNVFAALLLDLIYQGFACLC